MSLSKYHIGRRNDQADQKSTTQREWGMCPCVASWQVTNDKSEAAHSQATLHCSACPLPVQASMSVRTMTLGFSGEIKGFNKDKAEAGPREGTYFPALILNRCWEISPQMSESTQAESTRAESTDSTTHVLTVSGRRWHITVLLPGPQPSRVTGELQSMLTGLSLLLPRWLVKGILPIPQQKAQDRQKWRLTHIFPVMLTTVRDLSWHTSSQLITSAMSPVHPTVTWSSWLAHVW